MSRASQAAIVAGALLVEALLTLRFAYASFQPREAWLGALTVVIVGACGLLAWLGVPSSRIGVVLMVVAATFGAGRFALLVAPSIATGLLPVAVAAHAVMGYPSGRVHGRIAGATAIAYIGSVLPSPLGPVVLAAAILSGMLVRTLGRGEPSTSDGDAARLTTGGVLAAAVVVMPVWSAIAPLPLADPWLPIEVALVVVALALTRALMHAEDRRDRAEAVLVDLGTAGGDMLTRRLAAILGDPSLTIGYWLPERGGYVDPNGHIVEAVDDRQAVTRLDRDGRPVALLLHAPGRVDDPGVLEAIGRAADLAAMNARLQLDVERRRGEVEDSRRRLAAAGEAEREELADELGRMLRPRLDELAVAIAATPVAHGERPRAYLDEVRREIDALTRGLAPDELDRGLEAAVRALAGRCPIPVAVVAPAAEAAIPTTTQAALYFACSEALVNAARHGRATRAWITLTADADDITLEIGDDGIGGADESQGSGLRGLRERLAAVGGSLTIESVPSHGTLVRARAPLRTHAETLRAPGLTPIGRATASSA